MTAKILKKEKKKQGHVLLIVLFLVLSVMILSVWAAKPVRSDFDQDLYDSYVNNQFESLEQIFLELPDAQRALINIVPPGMPCLIQTMGIRLCSDKALLRDLVPIEKNGIIFYPITLIEDEKTRDHIAFNADGIEIASLPQGADYDSEWLLLEKVSEVYSKVKTTEELEELRERFDPKRVGISFLLISEKELVNYIALLSQPPEPVEPPIIIIMKAYTGPPVSSIQFTSYENVSTGALLTIAYPYNGATYPTNCFTNQLDIFASRNLIEDVWTLEDTIDVSSSTNWVEWLDTSATNLTIRFYAAANANCSADGVDTDGDGLSFGRERYLYHTSPTNSNTDGDSMDDGEEVAAGTDPNNPDDSKPTITIILPDNSTELIWIP